MGTSSIDYNQEPRRQLESFFRQLRLEWFKHHLMQRPHERDCEDSNREELRLKNNADLLEKFNAQTESILNGCPGIPLAPTSPHEITVGIQNI